MSATPPNADTTIEQIESLFVSRGSAWYGGEAVSQLEHALQAATFAEAEAAGPVLIVAALLHDVGHLMHELPENAAHNGVDDRHELLGATWLNEYFGMPVAEPVKMHVAAKRYLCAIDATYRMRLSPASQLSLQIQGGPMATKEATHFEEQPFFREAVRLRGWDDEAKIVGAETPTLDHFLTHVRRALLELNR
ncbi:MAG: HD domain-containing protein [Planctomycetaceae bacterium]|nr:HD domain-containing protein [Planctomycetales bacterium]MCB9922012.1 HD domain-containing protein [Planctomycetaceae bacterium]